MTSRPKVEFGFHLPVRVISDGRSQPAPASQEHLASIAAEALASGYASIWVTDHIIYSDPWMDCLLLLASVAGSAKGLKLAPGVLGLPLRHPVALAQTLSTLDIISDGNLIIGVGEGSTKMDFDALGLPFDERRKRLEEAVPLLRRLFNEEKVTHHGRYYSLEEVSVLPHPAQRPHPPIWLSSWGSLVGLSRVARLGDGWIASAWHSSPEDFASALGMLETELRQQGKDPATFPHAVDTMYVYTDPSDRRAREIATPIIEHTTGGLFEIDGGHYIVGDYQRCQDLLRRWIEAGARHIAMWAVTDDVEQVRRFAEHVLPQV